MTFTSIFQRNKSQNNNCEQKTAAENSKKYLGLIGLLIMPVISYLLFEYVTGNLQSILWQKALLNIGWYYCLYLIMFGLGGTTRFAVPVSSVLLFLISAAETFVVEFRDRPIMLWDIAALKTAMSVTKNYTFVISAQMKIAAGLILILNAALYMFPFRAGGFKKHAASFAVGAGYTCGFAAFFYMCIMPKYNYDINVWDLNSTYDQYGYMLSTAISTKYIFKAPPEGYSQEHLSEITANFEAANASGESSDKTQPVNIICIMNESFSDLSVAGDFTTNTDYLPFWNSLTENTIRGSLCVPVFGSMTSNTEFEFLTGDSISILPFGSNAYQFNVIKPGTLSLVSTLRSQGYTPVAMHPYPGDNWNRNECYKNMGFSQFYDIEYYQGAEELRNYVSDKADFDMLIEQVENKTNPDDRLFLFNVTMQNHGGYSKPADNFNQEVWLTGEMEGKYPEADRYLSLIKKSDEAFEYLINYFKNCDEPTMIVMFGDHQPAVEDAFYDEIAGMPSYEVPTEDKLMWYQTPFVIWTNYDQPSRDMGKLSAIYLSSYMLDAAGLKLTPYNNFLLSLSEDVPVIHPNGCYDKDGNYYYWGKAESERCPYAAEILDYECLAYNHSLDSKTYNTAFQITDENAE